MREQSDKVHDGGASGTIGPTGAGYCQTAKPVAELLASLSSAPSGARRHDRPAWY